MSPQHELEPDVFPANRRRDPRRRSVLRGKILLENDIAYDCVIRDISEHGARVRLTYPAALPETFQLIDISRGRAFIAAVMWRDLPSIGLQLMQPIDLTGPNAPAGLRRLWLECSSR